ncbi:hypothetical protein Hanom_Chr02g00127491 [Helianthus anomalus]
MSSVPTDTESALIPKIPVTIPVYEDKNGSEPVPVTPKVGTELVLKIFRFDKFGAGTQNNLLISDHEFHTNNSGTIQLF